VFPFHGAAVIHSGDSNTIRHGIARTANAMPMTYQKMRAATCSNHMGMLAESTFASRRGNHADDETSGK
jgi:hypothetical protein